MVVSHKLNKQRGQNFHDKKSFITYGKGVTVGLMTSKESSEHCVFCAFSYN